MSKRDELVEFLSLASDAKERRVRELIFELEQSRAEYDALEERSNEVYGLMLDEEALKKEARAEYDELQQRLEAVFDAIRAALIMNADEGATPDEWDAAFARLAAVLVEVADDAE